jgi:hypothetical protein
MSRMGEILIHQQDGQEQYFGFCGPVQFYFLSLLLFHFIYPRIEKNQYATTVFVQQEKNDQPLSSSVMT